MNKHFYSAGMAEHLRRAVSLHDMTHLGKVDWAATQSARTVRDFDRAFTVKMFGYRTTDHYYREASSAPRLHLVGPANCQHHSFTTSGRPNFATLGSILL